jgi:hypothetical protein
MRRWVTEVAAEEILVVPLGRGARARRARARQPPRGPTLHCRRPDAARGLAGQASISIENARVVEGCDSRDGLGAARASTRSDRSRRASRTRSTTRSSRSTFLQLAPEKRGGEDAAFWGDFRDLACRELDRIRDLVATLRDLHPEADSAESRELLDPGDVARARAPRESDRADVSLRVDEEPGAAKSWRRGTRCSGLWTAGSRNALGAARPGGESRSASPDAIHGGVSLEIATTATGFPRDPRAHLRPFFTTASRSRVRPQAGATGS